MSWYALMVPAGTPADVVARLIGATRRALACPDVKEKLAAQGMDTAGGTPEQLAATVQAETVRWTDAIRKQNIKVE